jgi:hypothetical protein
MSTKQFARLALAFSTLACFIGVQTAQAGTHSITHTQTTLDQTDFQALGFGQAGYYFAQFATSSPVTERAPQDNMRFALPSWASMQFDITQSNRTFSGDAGYFSGDAGDPLDEVAPFGNPLVFGVYSKGGQPAWDTFTLPNGELGLSGSLVDEHTQTNSNNSVNRIQLGTGTPSSFLLRIVVDNTNQEHDPAGRLRARGDTDNVGSVDVDVNLTGLTFNGTTDVYTFRYDNFVAGDFIKIQLNSGVVSESAGFAGIMFDMALEPGDFDSDGDVDGFDFLEWQRGESPNPLTATDLTIWEANYGMVAPLSATSAAVPEPTTCTLALAALCLVMSRRRSSGLAFEGGRA